MVKDGVCIIDVGITRVKSDKTKSGWKLLGDVAFDEVSKKSSFITPVPGGVGPMTIAMLLKNTLVATAKVAILNILLSLQQFCGVVPTSINKF